MEIAAAKMQAWQQQDIQEFDRNADIIGNRACFSDVAVNSNNLNVNVASSSGHIATAVFPEKQIAKTLTKVCPGATKVSATVANRTEAGCRSIQENACSELKGANIQEHGFLPSDRYNADVRFCDVTYSHAPQASYCFSTAYSSQNRPHYSSVQQPTPLSHLAEPYLPRRPIFDLRHIPGSGGASSFASTSGANFYPPWHVIQPPPGFTPLSYPAYDELFLPRPEFKKFNGNPLEFKSFITNFETHVEPRVQNKKMLFCLLLQHCADKVKLKIEYFGERGEVAYELAKNKLKREFGRPCIIADLCEQQLRDASQVKANDSASLKSFSELLERTNITLQNLQEQGSVNSLDFMTKLVNKLPLTCESAGFENRL